MKADRKSVRNIEEKKPIHSERSLWPKMSLSAEKVVFGLQRGEGREAALRLWLKREARGSMQLTEEALAT